MQERIIFSNKCKCNKILNNECKHFIFYPSPNVQNKVVKLNKNHCLI